MRIGLYEIDLASGPLVTDTLEPLTTEGGSSKSRAGWLPGPANSRTRTSRGRRKTWWQEVRIEKPGSRRRLSPTQARQRPHPIERARAIKRRLDEGASRAEIARELRVSEARVSQILSLLRLDPAVLDYLTTHDTPEHRRVLSDRRLRSLVGLAPTKQRSRLNHLLARLER